MKVTQTQRFTIGDPYMKKNNFERDVVDVFSISRDREV